METHGIGPLEFNGILLKADSSNLTYILSLEY